MAFERRPATTTSSYQSALERIRAEYHEMPGLRLTSEQVARLCGVEPYTCLHLLEALVDVGYLERTSSGQYARPADARRTSFRR